MLLAVTCYFEISLTIGKNQSTKLMWLKQQEWVKKSLGNFFSEKKNNSLTLIFQVLKKFNLVYVAFA